jgi:diguanylate cyclase (GGDEF)-like protein
VLLPALAGAGGHACAAPGGEGNVAVPVVRIGVLAKRGPALTRGRWQPTADYLADRVPGTRFVVVPLGFDEVVPAVDHGEIDFVLVNSGLYVNLEHRHGVSRVATLRNLRRGNPYTVFGGVLFTRADRGDIASLADLRGKRFMAVEEGSFGGYLMARRELAGAGLLPGRDFAELRFGGTHDAVVTAVLAGEVDAGTVRTDTLERMADEGKIALRDFKIVNQQSMGQHFRFPFRLSTRLYPEWPFAALAHVNPELSQAVAIALLQMPADSPAAQAGLNAGWAVPHNYRPVHELFMELGLPPYDTEAALSLGGVVQRYWYIVGSTLLVLSLLGVFSYRVSRLNRRLAQSQSRLSAYEKELEQRVEARTRELEAEVAERRSIERTLREHETRLEYLAHHDPLTRLPNRTLFLDRLGHALAKARREDTMVAVLFLDIDNFKKINDSLGHDLGDRLLQDVAGRLSHVIRETDTVARLGGDEFVVVLEGVQDSAQCDVAAKKILASVAAPITLLGRAYNVSVSIGIGIYPVDAQDVKGLMRCADTAMYRAKELGRDNYQYFTQDLNQRAFRYLQLESDLRRAIEQAEFVLHYQPQVDLRTGRLAGAECLIRWRHPEHGLMMPSEFIPLAEESGLIMPLGEWTLRAACRQMAAWDASGHPPIVLSVNLSTRQFRQENLDAVVTAVVEEAGIAIDRVELELTESAVMDNAEHAAGTLSRLERLGVGIAVDDFGTGYSSLEYLKRFPVRKLKIDRSFVQDISVDANDAAIVSATIALAGKLGLTSVGEGIETQAQVDYLRNSGCDLGQGFYFGRPLPADQFVSFFREFGGVGAAAASGRRA